jgi:hypothetical protein
MPELVQVWDEEKGEIQFRGKIYGVWLNIAINANKKNH